MLTLFDFLKVEDTAEFLQFTCPGTDELLWPSIRTLALRMAIDDYLFGKPLQVSTELGGNQNRLQKAKCVVDGLLHNVRFYRRHAPIVFFNSGVTNISRDGKYFNRVSDYFASCFADSTLLVEDPHEWQHLKPRANPNVIYHIPYRMLVLLASQASLSRVDPAPIADCLSFVDERLQKVLGYRLTPSQQAFLHQIMLGYCAKLKIQRKVYQFLYGSLRPKLIFFEDGSYGMKAPLIRMAKEMGILTAEMQHGMVSAGHDAYNYAPTIRQSAAYRSYLPDFFLTYGQWWSNQINLPAQVIPIGNPHYEVSRRQVADSGRRSKSSILLLSSGLDFQEYYEMARVLRTHVPGQYTVVLRPHPLERTNALRQYGSNSDGVLLDTMDNLYERLAQSYAVIGQTSTALFEAVGLVDKVFCISSPLTSFGLPESPFEQFENVEELAAKLFTEGVGTVGPDLAALIWAKDWEANYQAFISQHVSLCA